MAGAVSSRHSSGRQRVFVLVDEDSAKGVFYTWEAAESFADENQYSLDKLMEYETSSDYPDHLHLMAAKWDDDWVFQGDWSRRTPSWSSAPKRIRLDHYHARGNSFHLLRQLEFDWEEGLLLRINPMAPDGALESRAPTPSALPPEEPHWQPRVSPLTPLKPIQEPAPIESELHEEKPSLPAEDSKQETSADLPAKKEKQEINTDYDELANSLMVDQPEFESPVPPASKKLPKILRDSENLKKGPVEQKESPEEPQSKHAPPLATAYSSPLPEAAVPDKDEPSEPELGNETESELVFKIPKEEDKPKPAIQPKIMEGKPKLRVTPEILPESKSEEKKSEPERKKDRPISGKDPRISFNKKPGLKLKTKGAPTPIPSFKPVTIADINPSGKSSVELAHSDPSAMAPKKQAEPEFTGKQKKIWSLRLIITLTAVVVCWSSGIFWVLRPEPTATNIVAEVITLNRARKIIIEPKMVFYQFDVDPVHQDRYIHNLKLDPISEKDPIFIPTYHALDTWEKPNIFIRPPYADVEVEEWWNLRKREIKYGFTKKWEDGSILILDFESDTIIGWTQASLLRDILN